MAKMAVALMLLGSPLLAAARTVSFHGKVLDETKKAIPRVYVQVKPDCTRQANEIAGVWSDSDGFFKLTSDVDASAVCIYVDQFEQRAIKVKYAGGTQRVTVSSSATDFQADVTVTRFFPEIETLARLLQERDGDVSAVGFQVKQLSARLADPSTNAKARDQLRGDTDLQLGLFFYCNGKGDECRHPALQKELAPIQNNLANVPEDQRKELLHKFGDGETIKE